MYTVKLIPCITAPHLEYTLPIICHLKDLITFDLDVRSVTQLQLNSVSIRRCFSSPKRSSGYLMGSMIYGHIIVDPVQNAGDSFTCNMAKVFPRTGADGYVPKYNPGRKGYGCLADAPSLLYRIELSQRFKLENLAMWILILSHKRQESTSSSVCPTTHTLIMASNFPAPYHFSYFVNFLKANWSFFFKGGNEKRVVYPYNLYCPIRGECRAFGKRRLEYYQSALSFAGDKTLKYRRANPELLTLSQDIDADKNRGTNIQHYCPEPFQKSCPHSRLVPRWQGS
ncbi:hypothetical protein HPG69_006563 [Diceros bicornis minor]|uniref:Uncharacterized protein n=1 Tax=Diceros bicornis minor TaxID=77932 RepID=A0A7J7F6N3_DICBM|nr:hypothetical protein HPG69_006563 [Diceros bicornis minor]